MTDFPKEILAIARRVIAEAKDWPVDPSRLEWANAVLAAARLDQLTKARLAA